MIRFIAFLATLGFLAAVGLTALELRAVWQSPVPEAAVVTREDVSFDMPEPLRQPPPRWPAVFGEAVVPEPQPPRPPAPKPEPQPPKPPVPPIDSLGFTVKGVVSDGQSRWVIVSHPTGDQLLKVGDRLGEHYTVARIDAAGLWGRSDPEAEPVLLGFAE
jgi:hypothetical protein